ncbi:hypothetical protein ACOME3_002719 [Neoechinorhynchus agilis]
MSMDPALKLNIAQLRQAVLIDGSFHTKLLQSDVAIKVSLVWLQGHIQKLFNDVNMMVLRDYSDASALIVRLDKTAFKHKDIVEGSFVSAIARLEKVPENTAPVLAGLKIHLLSDQDDLKWKEEVEFVQTKVYPKMFA